MTGRVENLHAVLPVTFRFPDKPDITIEFVVDTGYLTLPPAAVSVLGLPFEYDLPANLADDSEILVPVYAATILWGGAEQATRVLAMGKHPLLGTALLTACELVAQFTEGGLLTVDPL
jgi:clan AA aspartic protease